MGQLELELYAPFYTIHGLNHWVIVFVIVLLFSYIHIPIYMAMIPLFPDF